MAGIDSYVVLGSHLDGADGATSATDFSTAQAAKAITFNGNAQLDTDQFKFGSASCLFDGTGDYLSLVDHADFNFGGGDWTWDCWVRFNSVASDGTLFSQVTDDNNLHLLVWIQSTGRLRYRVLAAGAAVVDKNELWSPSTGVWYHVALVR